MPVLVPGVKVVDAPPVLTSMGGGSTSITAFIGTSTWGPVGEAVLVTSWDEFKRKFGGLSTKHDLPYAVYTFFNNGGAVCYVVRTAHYTDVTSAETVTAMYGEATLVDELSEDCLKLKTKYPGTRDIKVSVENASGSSYDLVVKVDGFTMESFRKLTQNSVVNKLSASQYIGEVTIINEDTIPADVKDVELEDGDDGIVGLSANDIVGDSSAENGLHAFDKINIDIIAAFEIYSSEINNALVSYVEGRQDCFAVLDMPEDTDVQSAVTYKGTINSSEYAAVYYPWVAINDPVTSQIAYIPTAGFICGCYARNDAARGIWKAPAGIEMYLNGAIGVKYVVDDNKQSLLNPIGVNCIRIKDGVPTIWGSELTDVTSQYANVNGKRFQIYVKKIIKASFDWVVFEPIDEKILGPTGRIEVSTKSWLRSLDLDPRGGPFDHEGGTGDYYNVKADYSNNPLETRREGKVFVDVSYYQKGVAKEIVFSVGLGA